MDEFQAAAGLSPHSAKIDLLLGADSGCCQEDFPKAVTHQNGWQEDPCGQYALMMKHVEI